MVTTGSVLRPESLRQAAWRYVVPATAICAWGGNHFTPLLLLYRQVEGYSTVEVDLFLAFYLVGLVPGFLLAGPFSDRHGRRRLLFVALAVGMAASILLALGPAVFWIMCVGRFGSGISVAIAMVVGTSWIKELSVAPHDERAGPSTGARRAALTLTIGLGAGAGVSGVLAQWAPLPTLLPYAVQIALSVVALVILTRAPETRRDESARARSVVPRLSVAARSRFIRIVLPTAVWVFASAALAYAVTPALVEGSVAADPIAFATLLTVVTLAAGAAVQPGVTRLSRLTHGRQAAIGLLLSCAGIVLCAVESVVLSPGLALVVVAVLGLGYGVCLVSGLTEAQRLAGPDELGGVTGVYYSLTYVGFVLPVVLASLAGIASYPAMLTVLAALCLACAGLVAVGARPAK